MAVASILAGFDRAVEASMFPMLDNGYFALAASRLTIYRSPVTWALVVECFGVSVREGLPSIATYTFTSDRDVEFDTFHPIADGAWREGERIRASTLHLRDRRIATAPGDITDLCRTLAENARDAVLATETERRTHVPPSTTKLLVLESWHHPDIAGNELPSENETWQQLAAVLATGEVARYRPSKPSNTHWQHWPMGGTL